MNLKLKDLTLTEGRIPGENTITNPSISEIVGIHGGPVETVRDHGKSTDDQDPVLDR